MVTNGTDDKHTFRCRYANLRQLMPTYAFYRYDPIWPDMISGYLTPTYANLRAIHAKQLDKKH